jgi:hypothetical protein
VAVAVAVTEALDVAAGVAVGVVVVPGPVPVVAAVGGRGVLAGERKTYMWLMKKFDRVRLQAQSTGLNWRDTRPTGVARETPQVSGDMVRI